MSQMPTPCKALPDNILFILCRVEYCHFLFIDDNMEVGSKKTTPVSKGMNRGYELQSSLQTVSSHFWAVKF